MSRPRSRSPRYRRFPWEEPGFDPHKLVSELDGSPTDRRHRLRDSPGQARDYFREDTHPEGQRRSSPFFPDHRQFGHQRHPDREEFHHQRLSPHHKAMRFEDRQRSPPHDRGVDEDRRRGGFRESFENRWRSPPRLMRERLPQTPRRPSDHQQTESGTRWRREEQGGGQGRLKGNVGGFRDLSPSTRSDDQRAGADRERGKRSTQGPNGGRQRENPHHERNLPFKRKRREMDDADHLGYRDEEDFGEQGYSMEKPRDGFKGGARGSLPRGDIRHSSPFVVEHDHGISDSRPLPRWEKFNDRRDLDPDFKRQRSPRSVGSSQERFRVADSRSDDQEDRRKRHCQDSLRDSNYREPIRSPVPQDRPNTARYGNRAGPANHKGRDGARLEKRRFDQSQGGRAGPPRNPPRLQQSSQDYKDPPPKEQRPGYRPFREDYENPPDKERNWAEQNRRQQWEHDRHGSLDRRLQRDDLDPKMPRQREQALNDQKTKNMTVVTEETLTIKVDMSRPVNRNSPLCYSSDRQLSLDLVNVGRQRLDFLPMLEHSGTYRETAMHTGTFAQEIITLVHLVKEQYFRDDGLTLNERFSAPQQGGFTEEEVEELTLDERFSLNRGFNLNMKSLLDNEEPLFSRLGPMQGLNQQPVRGPGDLRHDLERRRQEKLEGVKVTILGNSMSQRPQGPVSEPDMDYSDKVDHEGVSNWPEEQNRRRDGEMGPRRGGPNRPTTGAQRRNNRFVNQRQNAGPNW